MEQSKKKKGKNWTFEVKMKYYVVKFLSEDNSEHVVVPKSWLKDYGDKTSVVVCPNEALSEERVRDDETPAADWNQHLCEIVDTSNSYSDAKSAAMHKNGAKKRKSTIVNDSKSTDVKQKVNCRRRRTVANTIHEMNTQDKQTTTEESVEQSHKKVFTQMKQFLRDFIDNATLMLHSVNECTNGNTSMLNINENANVNEDSSVNTNSYTKWMLLHQHAGPELIELMENSKIYVKKTQLERYTAAAKSPTNLIRTLMTLIFNKIALKKCTLSGKDFKLDSHAVNTLFGYVKLTGSKKGWSEVKEKDFNDCIRNKLAEVKRSRS